MRPFSAKHGAHNKKGGDDKDGRNTQDVGFGVREGGWLAACEVCVEFVGADDAKEVGILSGTRQIKFLVRTTWSNFGSSITPDTDQELYLSRIGLTLPGGRAGSINILSVNC